jgi:hypothetical protein
MRKAEVLILRVSTDRDEGGLVTPAVKSVQVCVHPSSTTIAALDVARICGYCYAHPSTS